MNGGARTLGFREANDFPSGALRRRINLHSPGFQFASTAANSNDNTGFGRQSRGGGGGVQRMQIPDYKLKLSLEGGLLPPLEERGAGRCYFVLENLNSNPARTVYSVYGDGAWPVCIVACKWASLLNKDVIGRDFFF